MDRSGSLARGARWAILLIGLFGFAQPSAAQETGRVVGRVVDAETGAGIVGVSVQVVGTAATAISGIDGRYVIARVPAGTVALQVQNLGYAGKIVTDLRVPAAGAVEQNIALAPQALELDAISVSAAAERGSVNRALDQQRTATNIVNAVTAEQIARSPDGDAAAALQRVSGVNVQDGKYIVVRGLGERYTTTSLNGARIPSPEPERKVVPLDMFPSGLLQTITTSKTFTPDQPGDFSGASVDIQTREFPAERQIAYSLSLGYNEVATLQQLNAAPTTGTEFLAFAGGQRQLPGAVTAIDFFGSSPSRSQIVGGIKSFRNAWSAQPADGLPNLSAGVSMGGNDEILGQRLGYLFSGTYTRSEEAHEHQVRANANATEDGGTTEVDRFEGNTGRNSVLWGGLANLSTLVGERTRLAWNSTYNRTADNDARVEFGIEEDFATPFQVQRLRFVERSVFSSQLLGEHEFGTRHRAEWKLTGSGVERNEPDRSELVYARFTDPATGSAMPWAFFAGSNEGAVRTFSALDESAWEAAANYRFDLTGGGAYLKVGGLFRTVERTAENTAYSISVNGLTQQELQQSPDVIFSESFIDAHADGFYLTLLGQGGSYSASDELAAGFAQLELPISDRLQLVGGARIESSRVDLAAQPTLGDEILATNDYTDILPALTLNVKLTDAMNVRLSAAQTLSRPEYRELAGIAYRDVIGSESVVGNPNLERALIRNYDARWEWYPQAGEVLSLGVFAKDFDNPIERVYLATSGTRLVTFVNAEGAFNYGVEAEARKRLGILMPALDAVTAFANVTVMRSEIHINEALAARLNDRRAMVGQAPYVVNAGVTWAPEAGSTSATLLYNTVGRRIVNAGEAPLPDVYEEARHVLDLSLRFGLSERVSTKLDARNLLDEPYSMTQGSVTREFYRTGRSLSVGFSWKN